MLPVKTESYSNACMASLIGVRSDCLEYETPPVFYVEEIEGITIDILSKIANVNSPSGGMLAKDIIAIAAKEMIGDLQTLIGNGNSLIETFGDVCSTCNFGEVYQASGGVKISNVVVSSYAELRISMIEIKANYTGPAVLVVDDGTPRNFAVNLTAGVEQPVKIDYVTSKKVVKVYMQNSGIQMANISCKAQSGCGCGRTSEKSVLSIRYDGLVGQANSSTQYGFKICAAVTCSTDIMMCSFAKQVPNLVGSILLLKVATKLYGEWYNSIRNNAATAVNPEQLVEMRDYFNNLYLLKMQGSSKTKGLNKMLSDYLGKGRDKCVECETINTTGWAKG